MKTLFLHILFCSFFVFTHAQNLILNGGFENNGSNWFLWSDTGSGYMGTVSYSSEQTHSGTKAAKVVVTQVNTATTSPSDRVWHIQLQYTAGFTVQAGQELRLKFWMKQKFSEKFIAANLSKNSPPYNVYDQVYYDVNPQWEPYEVTFAAPSNTSDIRLGIYVGADTGTYYVDDIELIPTGKIVNDNWYQEAESRIDSIRKGDFSLILLDSTGTPINGGTISAKLKQHHFEWGTALTLNQNLNADETWYRQTATQYFNSGVFENIFKWPYMEPSDGVTDYSDVDYYLSWAESVGWNIRGHALVWGGDEAWQSPSWIWSLPADTLLSRVERRIKRDVIHYKGKIKEYDVVNEPVHEKVIAGITGDTINHLAFKWAREADSSAKLYINDYSIVNSGGDRGRYYHMIQKLLAQGTPIDGVGVQGHFWDLNSWWSIRMKLDFMAGLGLPIKITEYDLNPQQHNLNEQQQAEAFGQMMRVAFSHPSVEGFLFWGFWDSRHWINNAGMFDDDKTPKPAADTVFHLIHEVWTTETNGTTASDGSFNFRGFYGEYDLTLPSGEVVSVFFTPESMDTTLQIGTGTSSIQKNLASVSLSLFPNPASGYLNFRMTGHQPGLGKITIFDLQGKSVIPSFEGILSVETKMTLPIHNLAQGMYFLVIEGENFVVRKKFSVN
ncbi:MAG: endo-1,4-beta-xylanase [Bacteroidia bacterium]|nr:endo-1,4-beta-xylanase [Bacteroidia bacterium]